VNVNEEGVTASVSAAVPPLSDTVPRTELPFRNCTLPVGVPTPGAITVTAAVNVRPESVIDVPVSALAMVKATLPLLVEKMPVGV
jgi:hypothetical protein